MTNFFLSLAARGFWVAFIFSALFALPILRLLVKLKSRQTISEYVPEHAAKQGTPTMGGLIVVVGVLAGSLSMTQLTGPWSPFGLLFLGFAIIGFVDDFVIPRLMKGKRGLGWKQKLGLEVLVAVGALCLYRNIQPGQIALGVFLILFYSNAYNFVDGMDGMAGGVGIFMLLGLFAMSYGTEFWTMLIVGALVPFLMLNAPPAKVFMGDVGSLPIGAAIGATVFDIVHTWSFEELPWGLVAGLAVISVVMFVALVPVPLQILSVKLRKKRLFLMTPVHHGFQKKGIPETRVAWGYIIAQLVCSALAITIVVWTSGIDVVLESGR